MLTNKHIQVRIFHVFISGALSEGRNIIFINENWNVIEYIGRVEKLAVKDLMFIQKCSNNTFKV